MLKGLEANRGKHPVWLIVEKPIVEGEAALEQSGVQPGGALHFVVTDGSRVQEEGSIGGAIACMCRLVNSPVKVEHARILNRKVGMIGSIRVESYFTKDGPRYKIITPSRFRYRRTVSSVKELVRDTVTVFKEMVWFSNYQGPDANPELESDRLKNVAIYEDRAARGLDVFDGTPVSI